MGTPLSGPGIGLAPPQNLYPSYLANAPLDAPQNALPLSPGETLPIPAGDFFVNPGRVSLIQWKDPVTTIWRNFDAQRGVSTPWKSDGFNLRVANLTGCPVAAVVTNAGSGYVESTTTVTPSAGNSTWQAIVGGQINYVSMANAGSGYGIPPLVLFPAPPAPGVQVQAFSVLTSGTVSSVVITDHGAGYDSVPVPAIVPNPTDPNFLAGSTIVQATVALTSFGSGSIAAILCTNNGVSLASVPTLTIAGAGASAAATVLLMTGLTGGSVIAGGVGYTTAGLQTIGGVGAATSVSGNPDVELANFLPRPAQAGFYATGSSLVSISTVYDSGLFVGTPIALVTPGAGNLQTTTASVSITQGGIQDFVKIQASP